METAGAITFNDAVWFCASGKAFYVGVIFLLTGAIIAVFLKKHSVLYSLGILILGLVLIGLSATPISPAWWLLWFLGFSILYLNKFIAHHVQKNLVSVPIIVLSACFVPIILEMQYWPVPSIELNNIQTIYVIGDSVSSGLGSPDEQTWPKILADKLQLPVVNLAVAGATAESALKKQIPQVQENSSLIIIEIGGNDILNSTKPDMFEKSMRQIFGKLETTAINSVWFELPLLPWKTEYGRIQRNLAKEFKVTLIPKRILSEVFQTPEATSDSIHLTEKGHQLLGQNISRLFEQTAVSQTPEGSQVQ